MKINLNTKLQTAIFGLVILSISGCYYDGNHFNDASVVAVSKPHRLALFQILIELTIVLEPIFLSHKEMRQACALKPLKISWAALKRM